VTLAVLATIFLGGVVATLWSFALAGAALWLPALFLSAVALMLAGVMVNDGLAELAAAWRRRKGGRR